MAVKKLLLITIAIAIVLSGCSGHKESQIAEIQSIKNGIEQQIKEGFFKKDTKSLSYSQPYVPTLKVIYIDKNQIVRKYIQEAGSDDSFLKSSFYYDQNGRLRFALFEGGAVNGSQIEHRVYFNSEGKRISENHENIKGPVYTFPEKWLDDELITNPIESFNK